MSISTYNSLVANEHIIVYRPSELYRNVDYVASPFVAVGDETISPFVYNNDICCFAGDKATFREGDTIAVNYNLVSVGAWTGMELYKNGTLVDTITIDSSIHYVDLTSKNLTYGKYKARMTDGANYSDYTEWEILQADVTCSVGDDGLATITITSANGTPVAVKVCELDGTNRAVRVLNEDEIADGTFKTDLIALNKQQHGDAKPLRGISGLYLKVYFQGEFGRATNTPLAVQF